ncbi:MAG: hypothetical protein AAFY28_18120, partial [Actinomycetota bacterium]
MSRSRSVRRDFPGGDREAIAATSSYMAVGRRWKYIYSAPDDAEFLFDHHTDPHETLNLAGVASAEPRLREMRGVLHDHLRRGGETAGLAGDDWKRFPPMRLPPNPRAGLLHQPTADPKA